MKALGDLTLFFRGVLGGDEMVEWFKALNFLRSDRCCPRIKSAKCSFLLLLAKLVEIYVYEFTEKICTY